MLADVPAPVPPWRLQPWDVVVGALLAAGAVALAAVAPWTPQAAIGVGAAAFLAPALWRIDASERRLPNALTAPLLVIGLGCAGTDAVGGAWVPLATALVCASLLGALWWTGGMGAGDVKLGAALALVTASVAWWAPLAGLAAAFVLGGVTGLVARARGSEHVPFGPWLLAGSGVAVALAVV